MFENHDPVMLTFDCGTQSIRALLFTAEGNIIDKEKIVFEPTYFSKKPGWAEQEPEFYFDKLCEASMKLKERNAEVWENIIAVTITTFRDSFVNLDKNGNVLRPVILWLDQRTARCEEPIPVTSAMCFTALGMNDVVNSSRKASRSNWIRENEPEIWEKTDKFLMLSGYLIYKLTGNFADSNASQAGHVPFDYKNKKWMGKSNVKYCIFNIERSMLPDLVEPGDELGKITKEAAEKSGIKEGLPLIASGSDKSCETLGGGAIYKNMANLSYGSAASMQITTERYVEPQPFLPAYPAVFPEHYNPEIQVYRGYWMITWFLNEFAKEERMIASEKNVSPEEIVNKLLLETPPGCDGLILQPYWGPGLENPEAKGSVIGFSDVHTRSHFYRAIIEGVGYALLDGLESVSKRAKQNIDIITVSGGGSQSDVICGMTADIFGRSVRRVQTYETAGLGSSIAGFVGMKGFSNFDSAIKSMVRVRDTFEPRRENAEKYREIFDKIYKKIYPCLKGLYKEMRKI